MSSSSVGYIIGIVCRQSINRTLARALIRLAPKNLALVEIPIQNLPVYNRDFDDDYRPAGRAPEGRDRLGEPYAHQNDRDYQVLRYPAASHRVVVQPQT